MDLLKNAALFESLPTQSLVRVAAIANELSWGPQQVVYHEGSPAESILMVLEGERQPHQFSDHRRLETLASGFQPGIPAESEPTEREGPTDVRARFAGETAGARS